MIQSARVLTVSDGVAAGEREDLSGPALCERLKAAGFDVAAPAVVSDGIEEVAAALRELVRDFAGLVITTGGTGFGPRDLTPEGTRLVIEREAPGFMEAIRRASDEGGRGFGVLSRGVAGATGAALIINTPGSLKGSIEALETILPSLPHALELLSGGSPH